MSGLVTASLAIVLVAAGFTAKLVILITAMLPTTRALSS
ncbi:hypothetical protein SALBM311S_10905 [Streptomyces alboniger]